MTTKELFRPWGFELNEASQRFILGHWVLQFQIWLDDYVEAYGSFWPFCLFCLWIYSHMWAQGRERAMHCRFMSYLMLKVLQQSVSENSAEETFGPNVLKFITSICVLYNSLSIDVYYFYQGHRNRDIIWEGHERESWASLIRDRITENWKGKKKTKIGKRVGYFFFQKVGFLAVSRSDETHYEAHLTLERLCWPSETLQCHTNYTTVILHQSGLLIALCKVFLCKCVKSRPCCTN